MWHDGLGYSQDVEFDIDVLAEELTRMVTKNLRLSDLTSRGRRGTLKLLSVRLPVKLIDRVDTLVQHLGSGKAEVVVALLNEGLERFDHRGARRP